MVLDGKQIYLKSEGDAWFQRCGNRPYEGYQSAGTKYLDAYLSRTEFPKNGFSGGGGIILEIGCSSGYNLAYLCKKHGLKGLGVEPSAQAVQAGNEWAGAHPDVDLRLVQGTSDQLPFEDDMFDIVMFGFCLCWTDRRYLHRAVSEADRVLKHGGLLVIDDFMTPAAFKRPNKHDPNLFTYKYDYAKLFLSDPCYSLLERTSYAHGGTSFDSEIQERASTSILYKENIDDVYQFCE